MSDIKFDAAKLFEDYGSNEMWIMLRVHNGSKNAARRLVEKLKEYAGKVFSAKIEQARSKRSGEANRYMWLLCKKLGEAMDLSDKEVYRRHILNHNIFREIEINESAAATFEKAWAMHGIGWICERQDYAQHEGFVILRAYYGSSTYSTKQMAQLIDGLVQDCRALDIETRPQSEIDAFLRRWKAV